MTCSFPIQSQVKRLHAKATSRPTPFVTRELPKQASLRHSHPSFASDPKCHTEAVHSFTFSPPKSSRLKNRVSHKRQRRAEQTVTNDPKVNQIPHSLRNHVPGRNQTRTPATASDNYCAQRIPPCLSIRKKAKNLQRRLRDKSGTSPVPALGIPINPARDD